MYSRIGRRQVQRRLSRGNISLYPTRWVMFGNVLMPSVPSADSIVSIGGCYFTFASTFIWPQVTSDVSPLTQAYYHTHGEWEKERTAAWGRLGWRYVTQLYFILFILPLLLSFLAYAAQPLLPCERWGLQSGAQRRNPPARNAFSHSRC